MSTNHVSFLREVFLSADVYAVCLQHALSTEKEEVMGLLIGELDYDNASSHITACVILHRIDKQPDRVEISPEQLCEAAIYAEELSKKLNRPMQVLGWYHSHPHITVWPSHVDLRTQSQYQIMESLFVGLIFSVFSSDSSSTYNKVDLTCFQARGNSDDNMHRREIAITIKPSCLNEYNLKALMDLPNILMKEVLSVSHEINYGTDEFAKLHNSALKALQLTEVASSVTLPMCDLLQMRWNAVTARIKEVQLVRDKLKGQVEIMRK